MTDNINIIYNKLIALYNKYKDNKSVNDKLKE